MIDSSAGSGRERSYRSIGYVPEFDGLRGLSLLVVVISHGVILYPVRRWSLIPGGFLGLDMFFVLSGFLITALLLREQSMTETLDFGAFYKRRLRRLLPALLTLLVFHWCYAVFAGYPKQVERGTLLSVCFYYLNWKIATGGEVVLDLRHLWSLSVEEQFYMVWPLAIATALHLRRPFWFVASALLMLIVSVAVNRAILFAHGMQWVPLYNRTDTRGDAILVGALTAQIWVRCRSPGRHLAAAATIASLFLAWCLAFLGPARPSLYQGLFTVIAFAWGIIVLAVLESDWWVSAFLRWQPLRVLGRVSYGAYLWHLPVLIMVKRHGAGLPPVLRFTTAFAALAAVTSLSWVLIERRFLSLKGSTAPGSRIVRGSEAAQADRA